MYRKKKSCSHQYMAKSIVRKITSTLTPHAAIREHNGEVHHSPIFIIHILQRRCHKGDKIATNNVASMGALNRKLHKIESW